MSEVCTAQPPFPISRPSVLWHSGHSDCRAPRAGGGQQEKRGPELQGQGLAPGTKAAGSLAEPRAGHGHGHGCVCDRLRANGTPRPPWPVSLTSKTLPCSAHEDSAARGPVHLSFEVWVLSSEQLGLEREEGTSVRGSRQGAGHPWKRRRRGRGRSERKGGALQLSLDSGLSLRWVEASFQVLCAEGIVPSGLSVPRGFGKLR